MGFWRDLFKTKKQRLDEYKEQLTSYKTIQIIRNREKLKEKENAIPLIKANNELQNTLKSFKNKRNILKQQWKQAYENFSWWNKIKYNENVSDPYDPRRV